jgi:hypothetical protein
VLNNPRTPNLKESLPAVNWLMLAGISVIVFYFEIVFCLTGDDSVFLLYSFSFSARAGSDANCDGVTILVSTTISSSLAELNIDYPTSDSYF